MPSLRYSRLIQGARGTMLVQCAVRIQTTTTHDANSLDDDDDSSVQSEDFYSFISYEVCDPLAYTLMRMSYSLRTVNRTQIRRFPAASCR